MPAREVTREEYLAAFEMWFAALRASGNKDLVAQADQDQPAWRVAVLELGGDRGDEGRLPARAPVDSFCKLFMEVIPWGPLRVSIRKSNLLYRLLYKGEALRSSPCPAHKGKWSGLGSFDEPDCPHGCGFTGWLL